MNLFEIITKPSKEEKEKHRKKKPKGGRLHYLVKDDEGKKILGYIDKEYVKKMRDKIKGMNKKGTLSPFYKRYLKKGLLGKLIGKHKISPKNVAKIRLGQIEYFKRNK